VRNGCSLDDPPADHRRQGEFVRLVNSISQLKTETNPISGTPRAPPARPITLWARLIDP